ncbi:hypothetical protein, partial [Kaarinaea lacus]
MNTIKKITFLTSIAAIALACIFLQSGCSKSEQSSVTEAFHYDQAALPGAKPWSTENFRNNPDNFQFAIIGDRTGGANALGTFKLAMDQINLLQPEFVINVGDNIEGYSNEKAELNDEWDQIDTMLKQLEMPFFRT